MAFKNDIISLSWDDFLNSGFHLKATLVDDMGICKLFCVLTGDIAQYAKLCAMEYFSTL